MVKQKFSLKSVRELQFALDSGAPRFQLIDSRTPEEYSAGHIPGAILVEWEKWCEPAPTSAGPCIAQPGYWGKLADPKTTAAASKLGSCGINDSQPIVVYADSMRSKGRDGRIAWMLLYFGAAEVYLLDGGWSSWYRETGIAEMSTPQLSPQTFVLQLQEERRITLDKLREHNRQSNQLLVDTRCREEFNGECYDYQPRKGRLLNSILFPFQDYYEINGNFAQRDTYLKKTPYHLSPENPVITKVVSYCEVGVRAATMALLHEAYTGQVVQLYDGSVMEWSHYSHLPMNTSPCGALETEPRLK